ncbi:MAG: ABC transporter ATP-binding protein [Cyclobacteriaceae bacterium]
MIAVSATGLFKSYGDTIALDELSFEVEQGQIFGLIGPDGAGKTTLLRVLTSLILPDKGEASVMGLDPGKNYKKLRQIIGYMPGRFSLYQDLSVEENLSLFASIYNTTIQENYHLIQSIYTQIEPFKDRRAGALSGGMKQKLALCCAMIHKPEILFLDEPTTGVDPVSRREFWEMLKELNDGGLTIIVSTPYMDEAGRCAKIALMQSGKFLAIDQPDRIHRLTDRPIYTISGSQKFQMLKTLRKHKACRSIHSFGSQLHFTPEPEDFEAKSLQNDLIETGYSDAVVTQQIANIEDTFMALMENHG